MTPPGADQVGAVVAELDADPRAHPWRDLVREQGPVALTRQGIPSHLTASAVAVTPDARRTVLVLHPRIGAWVQPGGHLEPGDPSLAAAAVRELVEETGLSPADPNAPTPVVCWSRHPAPCRTGADWHLDAQHVVVVAETPPRCSAESDDVRWFDVDDLPAPLAPGVADLVVAAVRAVTEAETEVATGQSGATSAPSGGGRSLAAAKPSRNPRARSVLG